MHVRVTYPTESVTIVRKITHLVSDEVDCYSPSRWNKDLNIQGVDGKTMCDIQRSQIDNYTLTKMNGNRWIIVVDLAILKIGNCCHIETPVERCHRNVHGF